MKKLLLITLLIAGIKLAHAQNVTGRWQADDAVIEKEAKENYQFFADGTFIFNVGEDETLIRVKSITGTYKFTEKSIILTATSYMETSGGTLSIAGTEPGTSAWNFDDPKLLKVTIEKPQDEEMPFKLTKRQNILVLDIDGSKYFKISGDPGK
jgi:hypothetical protein